MPDHNFQHLEKDKFQLDRVALFSDAVFAISITLLVIDIKVPELEHHEITDRELLNELMNMGSKFIGFFISFFVIGVYWLSHYRLFKYVTRINQQLLWLNLLFLLSVVIMPFSTAFLSEYSGTHLRLPLAFYAVNICFTGFCSYRLWTFIADPKQRLSTGLASTIVNYNRIKALAVPIVFILLFFISFWNMKIAYLFSIVTIPVSRLINRYYAKKEPALMKEHFE